MCGRFCLPDTPEHVAEAFDAMLRFEWSPRFNIAPTQVVPIVRVSDEDEAPAGSRVIDGLRWGLVPAWAKELAIGNRLINARGETAAEKPAFRAAWKRRRCLVPARAFFEWRRGPAPRQPYLLRAADGGLLAFAGLWERWSGGEDGEPIESFTILTTSASEPLSRLHDRMPVIVDRTDWPAWLGTSDGRDQRDGASDADLRAIVRPAPDGVLEAIPVSTHVNAPRNDDPRCIEPIEITDDPVTESLQ